MRSSTLFALTLLALAPVATVHAQAESRLESVELEGRLLEPKDRLLRFLGLELGVATSEQKQQQVTNDLQSLGYHILSFTTGDRNAHWKISVEPARVVRNITVHGNWPLFDDEVLRHLTVRSGDALIADDELQEFLDKEAASIKKFLERDGYFGGAVKIIPRQPRKEKHPEWVDLDIRISLGDWYKLGAVRGEGNHAITEGELVNIFGNHCCFRWGRFTIDRMREDARSAEKKLRDRGYPAARVVPDFDFLRDANPNTRRITLPVKVTEKRKVEVKFFGNRALADRDLREQLTIFSNGAYDEIELADSAKAVQRYYQQHGYFEAKVSFTRKRVGDLLEEVSFLVDEGPELKVRGVEVLAEEGEQLSYPADEVRQRSGVETKVFPTLGVIGLGSGGYVTNLQLKQDGDRIAEFYKKRGFPQVKVDAQVARDPASFGSLGAVGAETAGALDNRDDLYVRFYVHEGPHELVDEVHVEFAGPHMMTENDVKRRLKMTRGQPYTEEAFKEDQQAILSLYKASGRPYVVAHWDEQWNAAHDRFTVVYRIDEDGDVRFGEVLIRGNFKTLDRVILKDLPFHPGDKFDVRKLEEGERNLRTHLIFNTVRVNALADDKIRRNPVPVIVTVQERYLELFDATVAAGVATDKLPYYSYLQVGLLTNNFFGLGSQVEARFDTGFSAQSFGFSLRYTDLRAFGPGWRADFNGFYRREITQRLGPIETYGLSLGVTRYLTPALRLFGRYDIYRAQISVGFNRVAGPNDLATVQDNTNTAKIGFGVVWDRRVGTDGQPNPLAPVKGWLVSASAGWATPYLGGDHQFVLLSGQVLGLLPFKLRGVGFTLMGNLRYDEGIPIDESALPLVERFFAGGDTTTRGYDTDTLKSEIIRSEVAPLAGAAGFRVIPQGGNIRMLSTVEIQFPIAKSFFGLPFPWMGAVFYDAGAIVDALNLVGWSDIKHSIGISLLRIVTPVGPLSFEYAYPLSQSLAEERWKTSPWYSHFPGRIHFNWGIALSR